MKQPDITTVLLQVLQVALCIVESGQAHTTGRQPAKLPKGVYPHQSKYNPFRAYVWDKTAGKTIYLGAFPSVRKATQAQKAHRAGQPITAGTKATHPAASRLH